MTVVLDKEDRAEALEYLCRGRYKMLEKEPFIGYCAFKLGFIEDDTTPTLHTDGRIIAYNPLYVLSTKDEQYSAKDYAVSEVAHEVLHNILLHCEVDVIGRGLDPRKAGRAMDYAVNLMLKDMGLPVHKDWLCSEEYRGMTWREIYDVLPNAGLGCQCKVNKQEKKQPASPDDQKGDQDPKNSGEEQAPGGPMETVAPGASGESEDNQWDKIVVEAAKFAEAMGRLPAFAKSMVENITKPRVDWRAALYRFMSQVKKGEYSFRRPNKRYLGRGLILPSLHTYTAHAVVAFDTSGSTWAFLGTYWGEVYGILKALGLDIDVIQCDVQITSVTRIRRAEDIAKMERTGGGGTDFNPVFKFISKGYASQDRKGAFKTVKRPEVLVFFTDGYGEYPEHAPDYSVIWCVSTPKGSRRVRPPFGHVINLPA